MSLPDAPQTRGEVYLNAIATGDTSGLPDAPQCRMEQYLDVIANNGGGGSGTSVVANPTLTGNEDSLTGLQVGNTKYAVGGVLMLNVTVGESSATLDKTGAEITQAARTGTIVYYVMDNAQDYYSIFVFLCQYVDNGQFCYKFWGQFDDEETSFVFRANSPSDYPVFSWGEE